MSTCVLSSRFVDAEAVDADAVGSGCCSRRSSAASSSLAPVPVAARRERSTSLMGTCCIYSRKSGDFTNKTGNFVGIVAGFCWRSWYILQFKPPFVWKSHWWYWWRPRRKRCPPKCRQRENIEGESRNWDLTSYGWIWVIKNWNDTLWLFNIYIYIYLTTEIGDANFNIMLRAKDSKPAPTQKLAAKYV